MKDSVEKARPIIEDCIIEQRDTWEHKQNLYIKHIGSGSCLDYDSIGPIMRTCRPEITTQKWLFNYYNI